MYAKDKRIQELEEENCLLREELRLLKERLVVLERALGLNSGTSNKPPSSDGLRKKPAPRSLRKKGKKPSGGQKGHRGKTLEQTPTPDSVVAHGAETCSGFDASLSNVPGSCIAKRQVFDLPPARLTVTEHQVIQKKCSCGHERRGSFPADVAAPTQYGKRLQALVVYLMNQHFIPEDRLQTLLYDLFEASIATGTGTLASMNERFAKAVEPFQAAVLEQAKAASVKHLDETGFRIAGKTQWLHVVSTPTLTHYRVSPKRKDLEPLKNMVGIAIHDHWKPYFQLENVLHGLCNSHHLRELKALIEIEKETWASRMDWLLRLANRLTDPPIQRITILYDRIIESGLAFHAALPQYGKNSRKRRIGHNLLLRLKSYKDDVLRFLTTPGIPFTNNQAEQDIRMMKVKQKISSGFRTARGAEIFSVIRGFISTSRKQNLNILNAITISLG